MDIRSKAGIQKLLQSGNTLATVINAIIVSNYGEEAYDWDPLTVAMELKDDFEVDVIPEIMDKWCAIQIIMGSDAFFKRIDAFLSICNTLSSGEPFFSAFDPVTVDEAAWAIAEVSMNRDMLEFSPTIKAYLRKRLDFENFSSKYPKIFDEVLGSHPSSEDIREGLAEKEANVEVKDIINKNIGLMAAQFASIPELKGADLKIINDGIGKVIKLNEL